MQKKSIHSLAEKNRIIGNIIDAIISGNRFLIAGHRDYDEDCISSCVAMGLLLKKFHKDVTIYISKPVHEHFQYLVNICEYNSINVTNSFKKSDNEVDTIIICDTPKPSMIDANQTIRAMLKNDMVRVIEIDHHIGADGQYIGDPGYRLVTEASSASELVGHIALRLKRRRRLLRKFQIDDLFSRNFVLSILTGIIGDSQMGKFLKSPREKRYYRVFSRMYNKLLASKTTKDTNFSDKNQVYDEIQSLSRSEAACYNYMLSVRKFSKSIGYVILAENDIDRLTMQCDIDAIVSVSRAMADRLAEESGKLSLISYYDHEKGSDLIQFRVRRSKKFKTFDVRNILTQFSIENGGGHEGAIGFRIPRKELPDLSSYVETLIIGIENTIESLT